MNAATPPLKLTSLDKRLLSWLDNDVPRFERYIAAHPEVTDRIDQLLALGEDMQRALSEALDDVLAVPHGLVERLSASFVSDRDTSPTSVAVDLLGVGFATVSAWMNP